MNVYTIYRESLNVFAASYVIFNRQKARQPSILSDDPVISKMFNDNNISRDHSCKISRFTTIWISCHYVDFYD